MHFNDIILSKSPMMITDIPVSHDQDSPLLWIWHN